MVSTGFVEGAFEAVFEVVVAIVRLLLAGTLTRCGRAAMVSRYEVHHRLPHVKAVVVREAGRPSAVEELALRPLARDEVLVRLAASGVCHTDLSIRDGLIPALMPCTLGHEGAGIVTEVGDDVTTVAPDDHVVLTW